MPLINKINKPGSRKLWFAGQGINKAWALLRLASPQLPIGGYSYSQGLEMAVDNGRVNDPESAKRWISNWR